MDNHMFGLITYGSLYCKMDCKVLMDGYEVFKPWMLEHTGLDVDHYITIQPLASDVMLKSGCYDNVFQTSGVLQRYIRSVFKNYKILSCGLDPGSLKLETVRAHKQPICF